MSENRQWMWGFDESPGADEVALVAMRDDRVVIEVLGDQARELHDLLTCLVATERRLESNLTIKAAENERLRGEVERLTAKDARNDERYVNTCKVHDAECDRLIAEREDAKARARAAERPTPELVALVAAVQAIRSEYRDRHVLMPMTPANAYKALTAFLATPQGRRVAETMGASDE